MYASSILNIDLGCIFLNKIIICSYLILYNSGRYFEEMEIFVTGTKYWKQRSIGEEKERWDQPL